MDTLFLTAERLIEYSEKSNLKNLTPEELGVFKAGKSYEWKGPGIYNGYPVLRWVLPLDTKIDDIHYAMRRRGFWQRYDSEAQITSESTILKRWNFWKKDITRVSVQFNIDVNELLESGRFLDAMELCIKAFQEKEQRLRNQVWNLSDVEYEVWRPKYDTKVHWEGPGWYAGYQTGNTTNLYHIGGLMMDSYRANQEARMSGYGTPGLYTEKPFDELASKIWKVSQFVLSRIGDISSVNPTHTEATRHWQKGQFLTAIMIVEEEEKRIKNLS